VQFPYFQFPVLGDGLIIAMDAILHVIISHGVAIGMISMIVVAEYIGFRKSSDHWERFASTAIKPATIIITGVGAVTGVGIWFITSGLVPRGIGSMLRVFFWPWFIEWLVFAAEVIVVLVYYFTWRRWRGASKKNHLRLGIAYAFLAFASAFLITGILGFMLTPDGWPRDRYFWTAFFNPSFLPQLAWRIAIAFSMGGLLIIFYLLFSYRRESGFRRSALGFYARLVTAPLIFMPIAGLWWFYVIPEGLTTHAKPTLLMWTFAKNNSWFVTAHAVAGVLMISLLVFAWRRMVTASRVLIVPAILVVLFFVAEYERVREFIRGPYLMPGYMYANCVLMSEHDLFEKEGMLPNSYWFNRMVQDPTEEQEGAFLFAQNCGTCHTIGGKNDIRDRFRGRTEQGIYVIAGRTDQMVPWMPPFSGTDRERMKMARFIGGLVRKKYELSFQDRYPPEKEGGRR
jgi:mono/diheme cytochrome c family protein